MVLIKKVESSKHIYIIHDVYSVTVCNKKVIINVS